MVRISGRHHRWREALRRSRSRGAPWRGMAEGDTLSEPDDSPKQAAKPSALLQNLARIATQASGAHRKYQNARYGSSLGSASAGKRLTVWTCGCGWTGAAQELR